jgi:hypothetical protein
MGLVKDREYVRTEQVVDGQRQWITTEKPRVVPQKIEELANPATLLEVLGLRMGPVRQTAKGPMAFVYANGLSGAKRQDGTRFRSEVFGVVRYVRVTGPDGTVKNTIAIDPFRPRPTTEAPKGNGKATPAVEGDPPSVTLPETADPELAGSLEIGPEDLPEPLL